ncbi:hypothetical protein [Flavobacterium sp.]|uniref:hypothetical protein n=1 Tax=Flavobacterium sp. TaxID=239 RepID=UPI00286CC391|nr:hypothetical protein [Flavobacterium sp.]
MKKFHTLLIAVVAITSCSKEEVINETPAVSSNSLKRIDLTITTSGSNNVKTSSSIFTYNGNKIIAIKSGSDTQTYTYTGDLITKDTSTDTAEFSRSSEYTYESGKLKTEFEIRNNTNSQGIVTITKEKNIYTYNPDGTILKETYKVDSTTGVETKENKETVYTYANGNLVKSVNKYFFTSTANDNNGNPVTTNSESRSIEIYEYDNKKNPFINILGFKQFSIGESIASANNAIKTITKYETFTNNVLNPNSINDNVRENAFKYNLNDYPAEQTNVSTNSINNVISINTAVGIYIYE